MTFKTHLNLLVSMTLLSCSTNESQKVKKNNPIDKLCLDAKAGDPDAQFTLGFKYYFGDQVNQNRDSSKYWLDKAAKQGHEVAKKTYRGFFEVIPTLEKDSVK